MEIKKGTIVLVMNRKLVPFDRRVCLVIEADSDLDGWFNIVDWEGGEIAILERELTFLAQSKVDTRNNREAVASCYEEVIAALAAICDIVSDEH